MTLTIPATLFLLVVLYFLISGKRVKVWHAFVCVAFGYFLGTSSFALYINQLAEIISSLISAQVG